MRNGPDDKVQDIWKKTAATMEQRLQDQSPNNIWLSTAGDGISWLHVRLDSRPKYYEYRPYMSAN